MKPMTSSLAVALLAALLPLGVAAVADGQEPDQPPAIPNLDGLLDKLTPEDDAPRTDDTAPKDEAPPAQPTPREQRPPQAAPPAPTLEEQVDKAIHGGVAWLFRQQKDNGGWGDLEIGGILHPDGADPAGLLGLAYADVDISDVHVQKALMRCLALTFDKTQSVAQRAEALAMLHPRLPDKLQKAVEACLNADMLWLVEAQCDDGGWNPRGKESRDSAGHTLSHSAFAAMALAAAAPIVNKRPGRRLWEKAVDRCLRVQHQDGGWRHGAVVGPVAEGPSMGTGTACALTVLVTARDQLYGPPGCPCKGRRVTRQEKELDEAIGRGIEWLRTNHSDKVVPGTDSRSYQWLFWLACAERASGLRRIGSHDWFRELVPWILGYQCLRNPDHVAYTSANNLTSLILPLSLTRDRWPTFANKLQFDGQWNSHSLDLRNLARHVADARKEQLGWGVVGLDDPPELWHEAPILYLSAETRIWPPDKASPAEKERFTKDLQDKLRRYTDAGGTLLVEASCGARHVVDWWENTCEAVWPEWDLKPLHRKNHPLWTADVQISRNLSPLLLGIDDGVRTIVFFSGKDLSCDWNTNNLKKGKITFDLGHNLCAYATDCMKLAEWRAWRQGGLGRHDGTTTAPGPRTELTVARVCHDGDCGCHCRPWKSLAECLARKTAVTLKVAEAVRPGEKLSEDKELHEEVDLLYLCGRGKCDLGEKGVVWLRKYLDGGGFLFAEAACGDAEFDKQFRQNVLKAAGLTARREEPNSPLFSGRLERVQGYDCSTVAFTPVLAAEKAEDPHPEMYSLCIERGQGQKPKFVGLYSPHDMMLSTAGITAFGSRGYAPCDARALASNIVLLLTARGDREESP